MRKGETIKSNIENIKDLLDWIKEKSEVRISCDYLKSEKRYDLVIGDEVVHFENFTGMGNYLSGFYDGMMYKNRSTSSVDISNL